MPDLSFFGGKEAWVGDFLKLLPPDQSILYNYVLNAAQATDANAGFHIGMGLILLSQVVPRYGLCAADGETTSNLFVLLTASSGARKSACIKIGRRVGLAAGITSLISTAPGSREAFIDSLDDQNPDLNGQPRQALLYSEFSDFLGITATAGRGRGAGGHAATLRGEIMNVFDNEGGSRTLAAHRVEGGGLAPTERGTKHPMVSLIGASNYHVLSAATGEVDWRNGFFGRFLFIDGEMERFHVRQRPLPAEMTAVQECLAARVARENARLASTFDSHFPPCCKIAPYTDLTPEADAMFNEWSHDVWRRQQQEPDELISAAMPRLQSIAYRVALLLSFDYGEARAYHYADPNHLDGAPGWRIRPEEMRPAIYLAERHLEAYRYAVPHVLIHEEEAPIQNVEQVIRKADNAGKLLTEGEISLQTKRNDRTVSDALRTLIGRGVVRKVTKEASPVLRYQLVGGIAEKILYLPSALAPVAAPAAVASNPFHL